MAANTGPLRGVRLEYIVTMPFSFKSDSGVTQDTITVRVRMKESVGNFLNLKPTFPDYGFFKDSADPTDPTATSNLNAGRRYPKRAGFKFQSYKLLLKSGTSITYPNGDGTGGTTDRVMKSISIGFPHHGVATASGVGVNLSVTSFIDWVKSLGVNQSSKIKGIVTPSGIKYAWIGDISDQHPQ